MVRRDVLAAGRRLGIVVLGLTVGLLSASSAFAQAPPDAPAAPAAQATPVSNQRLFPNDGAMVLNFIKPDKTAVTYDQLVDLTIWRDAEKVKR